MLPAFNTNGYLPPGIHICTTEELFERFGVGSPAREEQAEELAALIEWSLRSGIKRLIVDGSFISARLEPNDVDLVLLPGPDYPRGQPPVSEMIWPFLQVLIAADDADLESWITDVFGTDRKLRPKGVIEVSLCRTD